MMFCLRAVKFPRLVETILLVVQVLWIWTFFRGESFWLGASLLELQMCPVTLEGQSMSSCFPTDSIPSYRNQSGLKLKAKVYDCAHLLYTRVESS